MECTKRPVERLRVGTIYHLTGYSHISGGVCAAVMYLGYHSHAEPKAGLSAGWQFLPIGWLDKTKGKAVVHPAKLGRELLLLKLHYPDDV